MDPAGRKLSRGAAKECSPGRKPSRGAAKECSPGRKPGVTVAQDPSPGGAKDSNGLDESYAPPGLAFQCHYLPTGLRPWLHSYAAARLATGPSAPLRGWRRVPPRRCAAGDGSLRAAARLATGPSAP
ncbi:MAG TPA: hypothetical protein VE422_12640, partial [Terriglobia bacterium]|nr:hypothetical protein [Terriglobia bacterium]